MTDLYRDYVHNFTEKRETELGVVATMTDFVVLVVVFPFHLLI